MRGKKFYIALIGLFLVGIGSVFAYKQQQEARALEFEGYEIATIEDRVDALYNEDKTDIQKDITSELEKLEQIFAELNEKDLSSISVNRIRAMEDEFLTAKEMFKLEAEITELFKEKQVVQNNVSLEEIEELETAIATFEDKTLYYSRNGNLLADARVQIETIEDATELVDNLDTEDLSEEELEKIEERVNNIKNEDIREKLLAQINSVRLALGEMEEEDIDEEETVEEDEEEMEPESDPLDTEETVEVVQESTQDNTSPDTNPQPKPTQPSSSRPNNTRPNNNRPQPAPTPPANNNQGGTPPSNNQPSKPVNNTPTTPTAPKREVVKTTQETVVVQEIPFNVIENTNNIYEKGVVIVYKEGTPGLVTETYNVTVYNDGTTEREFVARNETKPVTRVITVGTKEPEEQ